MSLSERIKIILKENNLKQKEFASSINVTESHISKLIRNDSGLSKSTAALIEELYGYSVDWILEGTEPKMKHIGKSNALSDTHKRVMTQIEKMNEEEVMAVKAFMDSLESIKKRYSK